MARFTRRTLILLLALCPAALAEGGKLSGYFTQGKAGFNGKAGALVVADKPENGFPTKLSPV